MDNKLLTFFLVFIINLTTCHSNQTSGLRNSESTEQLPDQFVVVLGIAQDAGYPQANCEKECCQAVWHDHNLSAYPSCIGLVDRHAKKIWMIDATPDFKYQLDNLKSYLPGSKNVNGIFLTHAHIGHYTGLMHLGHEVMGADKIPVFAMPRMVDFLSNNGPWDQLVNYENIALQKLEDQDTISISDHYKIIPILVPHRDEYSETVGYKVIGDKKSLLFIPDIDKWNKWDKDILSEIQDCDFALLDGTFYKNGEIPNRDMSQIAHPFIEESQQLFSKMKTVDQKKVYFIHLNHTNPLLRKETDEYKEFIKSGFNRAEEGQVFALSSD